MSILLILLKALAVNIIITKCDCNWDINVDLFIIRGIMDYLAGA